MKKLVAAAPVLLFIGTLIAQSCAQGDDQGTGNGGQGGKTMGMGGKDVGVGGSGEGGSGQGGSGQGGSGTGGVTGGAGMTGTGGKGVGGMGTGGMGMGAGGAMIGDVARVLNGQMLLGPCRADTQASVCSTVAGACPPANTADRALSGGLTTNRTITLGGDPNTMYSIVLHIQGEVEHKSYSNCADQNATLTSPRADGFCVGSAASVPSTGDAYNVYMIRVINPGATAAQRTDYFLNSLAPGVSNHTTYGMDYMATIKAMGGASIRLVAADSNCSMIKNCGPIVNDGNSCPQPIILQNIDPDGAALNTTFSFTTIYNGQWILITVKSVTTA
jgi:hypothetical protein